MKKPEKENTSQKIPQNLQTFIQSNIKRNSYFGFMPHYEPTQADIDKLIDRPALSKCRLLGNGLYLFCETLCPISAELRQPVAYFRVTKSDACVYYVLNDHRVFLMRVPATPETLEYWESAGYGVVTTSISTEAFGFTEPENGTWRAIDELKKQAMRESGNLPKMRILGKMIARSAYNHDGTKENEAFLDAYEYRYATDEKFVYLLEKGVIVKKYPKSDPDSFEILSSVYAKDINNVYVYGERKTKIDAASFRVLCDDQKNFSFIGADDNHVYVCGDMFKHVDSQDFVVLNAYWGKNKSQVLNLMSRRVVKNADAKTFEVSNDIGGAQDAFQTYKFELSPRWRGGELWEEIFSKDVLGCARAGQTSLKSRKR